MNKLLACIAVCAYLLFHTATAQVAGNADHERKLNFFYQVKIIDEFIERFNDDPTSELRKAYVLSGTQMRFNRQDLINSLFDKPARVYPAAITFVAQVTDTLHPQMLSLSDTGWYAEVQYGFQCNGRELRIPLILQLDTAGNKARKWMIAGIGNSNIFNDQLRVSLVHPQKKKVLANSISPAEYGTYFLELHHILTTGIDAPGIFRPELLATDRGKKFVQLLQSGQLSVLYPGTMKFHFFQVSGFIFTVERFIRDTRHSGWLISSLVQADEQQKRAGLEKLLRREL